MAKSKKTKGDLQKKLRVRHKLINTNFAYNRGDIKLYGRARSSCSKCCTRYGKS